MGRSGVVATGRGCLVSALPARGELWWCELAEVGRRPVLVLSRNAVIPRVRHTRRAVHDDDLRPRRRGCSRTGDDPVPLRGAVNLDSVESVSVAVLVNRLGRLADTWMRQISRALEVAVDCSG